MEIRIIGETREIAALVIDIRRQLQYSSNVEIDSDLFAKAVLRASRDSSAESDASKESTE